MEVLTLTEIADAIKGEIVLRGNSQEYSSISTDTRKIKKGDIFIALKGEKFNANKFVKEAVNSGATLCIVDELMPDAWSIEGISLIKVENTGKALLDLARYYRKKLRTKIVGITGSTGKTSTKDLTAAALSSRYKVFKTKGNFNNEVGLPLMIFSLDNTYDVAVLEMGMSNLGEIHRMTEAARPDCALITNVGITHIEYLKTRENILKAKLEITDFFGSENTLIVNSDSELLSNLDSSKFRIIDTSAVHEADYSAYDVDLRDESVKFRLMENGVKHPQDICIDMPGKHTVNNALLAIACARLFGLSLEEIMQGLKKLEKTSMRLDIIRGERFIIINDCYNASPDSMKSGLEVLKNLSCSKRVAILGSMGELGNEAWNAHKMVGEFAADCGIDFLITLGKYNDAFKEGFGENCHTFEDYNEAVKFADSVLGVGDAVIVKASRFMKFENIVDKLKQANHLQGGSSTNNG
ncbi:MAG: UDP-N-acetylmuramoyl-tripeptide--D-alanyl-D-alanine ligase [Clostridiaceae bacterium]